MKGRSFIGVARSSLGAFALSFLLAAPPANGDLPVAGFEVGAELSHDAFSALHGVHASTLRALAAAAATNWLSDGRLLPAVADAWAAMLDEGSPKSGAETFASLDGSFGIPKLPSVLVEDFFAGAVVMLGPCDGHGAVFAYSNPFWDALLFVRTGEGELPTPGSGEDGGRESGAAYPLRRVPKVQEAVWIDGATLRGGPAPDASDAEPCSVLLWRVAAANRARFEAVCPGRSDDPVRLPRVVRDCDRAAVAAAMRERAGRRAGQLALMAKDPVLLRATALCGGLLRDGTEAQLVRFFDDPDHAFFAETLAALPRKLRASFVPAGARKAADGAQLLFVARDAPRVFATVSFPAGRLSGTSRDPVQMEWYDFERTEDYLSAWWAERRVSK